MENPELRGLSGRRLLLYSEGSSAGASGWSRAVAKSLGAGGLGSSLGFATFLPWQVLGRVCRLSAQRG